MNNKTKLFTGLAVVAMVLSVLPNAQAATAFGTVVGATDFDATHVFDPGATGAVTGFAFGFFDDDGDGTVDLDDPVYFAAGGAVAPLDVRISVEGFASGSQVKGIDGDNTLGLGGLPGLGLSFVDLDSSGGFTAGDSVYLSVSGTAATAPGDIRITASGGKAAGSRVGAADNDLGSPLTVLGATGDYFDLNGDLVYGRGDIVYLDSDASVTGTINDVRLMPTSGTAGTGNNPPPTTTTGPPPTTTTAPTTNPVTTNPTTTTAKPKTPGFELVSLVAVLGASLVLLRRKL